MDTPFSHLPEAARAVGHPLSDAQLADFARFRDLLLDWNTKINVTAIREPAAFETLHLVDSLAGLRALPAATGATVIDIGSGGGLPGLALRLARPDLVVTLVDSIAKKALVMTQVVAGLGLDRPDAEHGAPVTVRTARAEDLGQDPQSRERHDVAVVRAVADLAVVAELALPLVKVGGRLVVWKKRGIDLELAEAAYALATLGGRTAAPIPVDLPGLPADRQLVVIDKVAPTPAKYPRSPGTPRSRPLTAPSSHR